MWNLIVSVSDHCLSFYFENSKLMFLHYVKTSCLERWINIIFTEFAELEIYRVGNK